MKTLYTLVTVLFLASCSSGDKPKDKKTELDQLKKERTALNDKIAKLEAEMGGDKNNSEVKEVAAEEMKEATFENYVEVQGKVDAVDNVEVTPQIAGAVTAVYVKAGQH